MESKVGCSVFLTMFVTDFEKLEDKCKNKQNVNLIKIAS